MDFPTWLNQLRQRGSIQPIEFGMSRDALQAVFGEPDDTSQGSRKAKRPMIFRYGRVEFHFGPAADEGLEQIFSETSDGVVEHCLKRSPPDNP